MTVDRDWVRRNLGFDPIEEPAPAAAAFAPAAGRRALGRLFRWRLDELGHAHERLRHKPRAQPQPCLQPS